MNKIFKKLKKFWLTIWIVVAALSFATIVVYASYTRVTIAKRVISTGAGEHDRFSSNMLNTATYNVSRRIFSSRTDNPLVTLEIYNYPFPNKALFRNEPIYYSLKANLGILDDNNNFTPVTAEIINGFTYSITYKDETFNFGQDGKIETTFEDCVVAGKAANSDNFTLVFDKNELSDEPNRYCMEIIATPNDAIDLPILKGYISVAYAEVTPVGWKGMLTNESNTEYDGYNYVIEGVGKGIFTFQWNSSQVEINKQFLKNKDITFVINSNNVVNDYNAVINYINSQSNDMKSLTIAVDSSEKSRYEVQFFKREGFVETNVTEAIPDSTDWIPEDT